MTTDPEIIKDLLPLYRSGLASAPSRRLVEAWLAEHAPEAARARDEAGDEADAAALRALERARRLSRWLRWLYGLAIGLTVLCFSTEIRFSHGRLVSAHLVAFNMPWLFGFVALSAAACWVAYALLKRRLR